MLVHVILQTVLFISKGTVHFTDISTLSDQELKESILNCVLYYTVWS